MNKYLQDLIKALLKVVPSSYFISSGFSFNLLYNNRLYSEMWFHNNQSQDGMVQLYTMQDTNYKIDKAEETLGKMCQELMSQGKDALYNFIVFLVKSYCKDSGVTKLELRGLKIALRSIGVSNFDEIEKYAKDTPLMESIINIGSWPEISNAVDRIKQASSIADSEIDFQNIGNSCRNLIISLAQKVYKPIIHGDKNDEGKVIGNADAMGMLTNYFASMLSGSSNDEYRNYAKATHKIANMLTHRRNATKKDMELTISATIALVNLVFILENVY